MTKKSSLSETILLKNGYKRKFSFLELYCSFVYVPRAILKLIQNKKSKLVDSSFIERLQLAVTEVNGCAACSYQHTQMALEQGMSSDEITSFLSGDGNYIKPYEAKAIMFAQHFADTKGYPHKNSYNSIVAEYGEKEARIILSAVQVMIAGNMYGIPLSAVISRFHGKPYKGSSLIYEIGMLFIGILYLPIAIIHAFIRGIFRLPNSRFDTKS